MDERTRTSPRRRLDEAALAQKVRWEGGLSAALECGVTSEDIENPEMADLWRRLQHAFEEWAPLAEEAAARLGVLP